jgi:AraC-like DNA-binding protein
MFPGVSDSLRARHLFVTNVSYGAANSVMKLTPQRSKDQAVRALPLREDHLAGQEHLIKPGREWSPPKAGWQVLQIQEGVCYHLQSSTNQELQSGTVLLLNSGVKGMFRASQLGPVKVSYFGVVPARLAGLVSLSDQRFFDQAAKSQDPAPRIFAPETELAARMKELFAQGRPRALLFRLDLFRLFVLAFSELLNGGAESPPVPSDARKRCLAVIQEMPASELLEMDPGELAQMAGCTPRHLSRIFHKLTGKSFRDKRAEFRLAKASELLLGSDFKVVDVALESGFKSLSLFNLMFARRFGTSPGKWRQNYGSNKVNERRKPNECPDLSTDEMFV